jgi:tetratricopeptide (TPR) repeat protein
LRFTARHLDNHGQENIAAKLMRDAIKKFPGNYNIFAVSADVHRKIKDYNSAQQYYEKAAELNPTSPSAQMNLGAMYHLLMKFNLAEKCYLKTLELAPGDRSTIDNLKKLRNTMKQKEKIIS